MKNIAVILAAGSGTRVGSRLPKQFLPLAGKRVIDHSLSAFEQNDAIGEVCVVAHPDYLELTQEIVRQGGYKKVAHVIGGGKERTDSTLAALRLYKSEAANLLIHDAARPLVSQRLITDVCRALERHSAVNVALPSPDTLVMRKGDFAASVPDRNTISLVQTPQGFRVATLLKAYTEALRDPDFRATDDCGVVVRYLPDVPVFLVEGEETNRKLTSPDDLPLLEQLYAARTRQEALALPKGTLPADFFLRRYRERELRPLQQKMADMLTLVTDILERNDIPYWLDGGTLLGAVRHGGFIPWDDDVDIDILHTDLDRAKEALRRELPPTLDVPEPTRRNPILKVRDLNSFFVEFADDLDDGRHKGIFVDIFPVDDVPSFPRPFVKAVARRYCKANSILHRKHYYSLRATAELVWFSLVRTACRIAWTVGKLFFRRGTYVTYSLSCNGYGVLHSRKALFPLKKIRFADREFFAPARPEDYLEEHFGNWQTLPPEEQRQIHALFYDVRLLP